MCFEPESPTLRILAITSHYLPGYKAGGPVRSVANLVQRLGDEFQFRVIASDRDLGDAAPYAGIRAERWQSVGKAKVAYLSPLRRPTLRVLRLIREARPDVLYLNSFFNHRVCLGPLLLRRCGLTPRMPVVIAPRGEFSRAALAIHAWKKRPYLAAACAAGLFNDVVWQATSELEREDIERVMGRDANIVVALNLSSTVSPCARREPKQAGRARLAFLSRISEKKNLLRALESLQTTRGEMVLDIWGPIEDRTYWRRCQRQIERLPVNVVATYRGAVAAEKVPALLSSYDALLLPTLGENFGHAIVEALSTGCPALISDRTPWRNLRSCDAGWDVPLESPDGFGRAIAELMAMDEQAHRKLREGAARFGRGIVADDAALDACRELFTRAYRSAERPFNSPRRAA